MLFNGNLESLSRSTLTRILITCLRGIRGGTKLSESKYNRKAVVAAAQILKTVGHSSFDRFMVEIQLPESRIGTSGNLTDKSNSLLKFALDNPTIETADGDNLWDAIVERAIEVNSNHPPNINIGNVSLKERQDFEKHAQAPTQPARNVERPTAVKSIFNVPGNVTGRDIGLATYKIDPPKAVEEPPVEPHRVFIVHGRDLTHKAEVARFIERQGFEAIILHEQPNKGKTVIEKFIANSDVHFAVVLLTPDDVGGLAGGEQEPRARQNVILEWGFFIGALGRDKVMALMKGHVDLPTDVVGIVWEALDEAGAWKKKLAIEMKAAGFKIDWEKAST